MEDGVWLCGAWIAEEYPPMPKAEPHSGRGGGAAVEGASLFLLADFGRNGKIRDERLCGCVVEMKSAKGLIWETAYGIIFVF